MHAATTMWVLLALPDDASLAPARRRALDAIKDARPGVTLQSATLPLLIAHRFGDAARAADLRAALLARQNADGGWAWLKDNRSGDAFATGQALYALGKTGLDGADPSVGRAWDFLLRTQTSEGGWHTPQEAVNTRPRKLNVYDHWGTAWAAIGLLETLPADRGAAAR
jgi:hypothetical protein